MIRGMRVRDYKQACKEELDYLVSHEDGLEAALLCSVDGLPVAYASDIDFEMDSLSAMCSSMLSLGDALAIQGGRDHCIQVVTQSENRTIALIHAGDEMLLVLVGGESLRLGMLLSHARTGVERIIDIVANSKRAAKRAPTSNGSVLLEELVNRVIREAQER